MEDGKSRAELPVEVQTGDRLALFSEAVRAFWAAAGDRPVLLRTIAQRVGQALADRCVLRVPGEGDPAPQRAAVFERAPGAFSAAHSLVVALGATGCDLVLERRAGADFGERDRELAAELAEHAGLVLGRSQDSARAQRFLEAIVENIPDMIFVKDADRLAFELFNRAGEELLGIPRSELLGRNDYDFFPPEQAEFFQEKDRSTLRGKQLVDIAEEPIDTKRGRRWLHTKKVPILDERGAPRYLLGISDDITERKQAAEALLIAKEAAEVASRELESFSYSVAHDLRAPLRSIDGFSHALGEEYGALIGEVGRGYLERVRGAARRMGALIDDLLTLARVTRSELRWERVDLSAEARAVLARLAQLQPERRVEVQVQPDLIAEGDPGLLAVVLENLLGNAWKFTGRRAAARIEFGASSAEGGSVYFVRDNGSGFSMEFVGKLFGVFQRLHEAHEFEGTGIGLATVQRIVARHGGRVWGEGEVDRGATFSFTLGSRPPV